MDWTDHVTNIITCATTNTTQAIFPFPLDDFQTKALEALGQRENVVVSAPTGSGACVGLIVISTGWVV